jgi:protease I
MTDITGKRIAIVSSDYFEESELMQPLRRLRENGASVEVVAPHDGTLQAVHGDVSQTIKVPIDKTLDSVSASNYDAIVLPGGVINADHLRVNEKAQQLVRDFAEAGKPIAAICHGPWLLVSSGLVNERKLTSYHTLADDIKNAGGTWVDEKVVVDSNLITSRKPDDLSAFTEAIITALAKEV